MDDPSARTSEAVSIFEIADKRVASLVMASTAKSRLARECLESTGVDRFDALGYDGVAQLTNRLAAVGALPVVVDARFATGADGECEDVLTSLGLGWARACHDARATWGGRESQTTVSTIGEFDVEIIGSALGLFPTLDGGHPDVRAGDELVLISDSGLGGDGIDAFMKLAADLPDGYSTSLGDDTLAAAVLRESQIYVPLVETLLRHRVEVTSMSYLNRDGFKSLLKEPGARRYCIDELPNVPDAMSLLFDRLHFSDLQAYSSFNMGVGFAICCRPPASADVTLLANLLGYQATVAGHVENGPSEVKIAPAGVTLC